MHRPLSALVITFAAVALPAQMSGSYVIDPTGPATVFHSFTEAVNAMFVAGVSGPVDIVVTPGTYTESVLVPPIAGASATNTITFRSLLGPGTVLLGGAAGDTFALLAVAFLHTRSIHWDGIDFTGAPGHAISATSFVEDLEIRNCRFAAGHRSTAAGEYRHAIITSENSGQEVGWRVHHNHFTLSSHTNRTSYGIYLSNGGEWDFHHNTMDMNGADYGLWMINNNRRVDRVYDNLFVGTLHTSTSAYSNSIAVIRADISNYENWFVHNTFAVTIPGTGCCISTGGFGTGAQTAQNYIYGNVFVTVGGTAVCVTSSGTAPQPFLADGNVYWCPGGELGRTAANATGFTTLAGWQTASMQDTNSLEADPQLQSAFAAPYDLRPSPTSPVRGVARNTPTYVTTDYAGRLRDAQPDAGAYESTSFALYGAGCAGTGSLVPAMGNSGTVALGSTNFAFELTQARTQAVAVLFGGLSRTQSGALPLPFSLGGTCNVLASPDAVSIVITSANGTSSSPFPIPNAAGLSGIDLFFQWAVVDSATVGTFGVTVTEGGALQL